MTALEGVKVLDFTHVHAGPFATMVLADLGATVIKIERPQGDESRNMTLFSYGDMSAFFVASNRNKRACVLDLNEPADRETMESLVRTADIVVDNFRPGTRRRLGLEYESLHRLNPSIITVSVSGYGSTGNDIDVPTYDVLSQARAGVMSVNGEPGQRPLKVGVPIGDLVAGLYAAIGAIAALDERRRTGRGQRVDISMLDAQVAMLHYHYVYYDASGQVLPRVGSEHQNMVPYGIYKCSDGYLALAVVPDPPKFWRSLCEVLGHPEWHDDERFVTPAARLTNRTELTEMLETVLRTDTRTAWYERLREAGVPAAPVNDVDDLAGDPQIAEREMLVRLTSPSYGTVTVAGNPIKMDGALPVSAWLAPPTLNERRDFDPTSATWLMPTDGAASASSEIPFSLALISSATANGASLRGWRCAQCDRLALGIRVCCPVCGHEHGREVELRRNATLDTWSSVSTRQGTYVIGYGLVSDQTGGGTVRVFAPVEVDDESVLEQGQPLEVAFRVSVIDGHPRLHHYFIPSKELLDKETKR